jgi:UDP-N-acetylglucosamine:LPS N-acetylglucosamine transferase
MNAETRAMEEELKTVRTGLWQLRNMESMLEAERREKEELLCEIEFLKAEKSAFFKIALDMYQAFSYKDAVGVQKAMAHFKENSDVVISVGGV